MPAWHGAITLAEQFDIERIPRVSHFGKKLEFSSVNPGSHSIIYIRKVSPFSEFSGNIYYSPVDMQILL